MHVPRITFLRHTFSSDAVRNLFRFLCDWAFGDPHMAARAARANTCSLPHFYINLFSISEFSEGLEAESLPGMMELGWLSALLEADQSCILDCCTTMIRRIRQTGETLMQAKMSKLCDASEPGTSRDFPSIAKRTNLHEIPLPNTQTSLNTS